MAEASIKALIQCIEGQTPHNLMIPSKIVYRESCDCNMMAYRSMASITNSTHELPSPVQLANDFLQHCSTNLPPEITDLIRDFVTYCYQLATNSHFTLDSPQTLVKAFFAAIHPHLNSIHLAFHLKNCIAALKTDLMNLCKDIDRVCYIETVLSQITHELLNYLLDYYSLQTEHLNQNFSFTRQFLLTITHNSSNKKQQLQSIIPSLKESGITSCLIYLYPESIPHGFSDEWKIHDEIYLYMGYIDDEIINTDQLPLKVPASELAFYGFKDKKDCYTTCVHPIFFDTEQLGIMVFEMNIENYALIDNLILELGCALKLTSTFTLQRQIENQLETLSQTDELTGLLNRRGFFNLAQTQYDHSLALGQTSILFYADMDDLKIINDTYGHDEGDYAIITMGKLLKKAFSNTDIIARIGGDEFVILATNKEKHYIEEITKKINHLCQTFNDTYPKTYELNISIGSVIYQNDYISSLEALLSKADSMLYHIKKSKKKPS